MALGERGRQYFEADDGGIRIGGPRQRSLEPAGHSATSPKVPGWVSISTPAPVEILEHGRVIGASWNGGVRLAPGRHDVRLLNRAEAIDLEQSLDIAPDSMTSVVVELAPDPLHLNAASQSTKVAAERKH